MGFFNVTRCGYYPKEICPYPERKKEQEKIRDKYGHWMPGEGCDVFPECPMWMRVVEEDINID